MLGVNQLLVSGKALGGSWPGSSSLTSDLGRTLGTQAAASLARQIKEARGPRGTREKHKMQL